MDIKSKKEYIYIYPQSIYQKENRREIGHRLSTKKKIEERLDIVRVRVAMPLWLFSVYSPCNLNELQY